MKTRIIKSNKIIQLRSWKSRKPCMVMINNSRKHCLLLSKGLVVRILRIKKERKKRKTWYVHIAHRHCESHFISIIKFYFATERDRCNEINWIRFECRRTNFHSTFGVATTTSTTKIHFDLHFLPLFCQYDSILYYRKTSLC